MVKSFGEVLDKYKGVGPGFDFARVFLAFGVLAWHSPLIATGDAGRAMDTWLWITNYSILPMFFGLSGFLVAGSAQRLNLKSFAISRGIRIFPALIVEITLSAFVLGAIFTSYSFAEYIQDHKLYRYLLNIFGIIHYTLPGVFEGNPFPRVVNGSLWTVPLELICYFVMAGLIVSGYVKRPIALVVFSVVAIIFGIFLHALAGKFPEQPLVEKVLATYLHGGKGILLLPCFLLGAATYALRYKIPFRGDVFVYCLVFIFLFGLVGKYQWWSYSAVAFVTAPVLIYITIYTGLSNIPKIPYFSRGDYSYGIYLYGFPIQQAVVAAIPELHSWVIHLLISAILVTAFATFSWHFIEKPILKLRKYLS